MKNYTAELTEITLKSEVLELVENYNNDFADGIECQLDVAELQKTVDFINKQTEKAFYTHFCYAVETLNRNSAFTELLTKPSFEWLVISVDDNGKITIKDDKTRLVSFAKLEKFYQIFKSTDNDKNGKPIANKSVTIFEQKRIYGLTDAFTRNLLLDIIKVDGTKYDLSRVKIGDVTIFTEKDGECFATNSKTALDKQLNIIVKFFGLDLTMRKTDLAIIKQLVLKIRQDKSSGKFSAKENNTFKMLDIIFGVMCSRFANEDVKIQAYKTDKDGKTALADVTEIISTEK